MINDTLRDLYIDQLRDLYSAETQLAVALPQMARAAHAPKLREAFEKHGAQTQEQARRVETLLHGLGHSTAGRPSRGIAGLIEDGRAAIHENEAGPLRDAALIAASQRVEHVEIAGYGTARALAQQLGETRGAEVLQQSLQEEEQTDEALTALAGELNPQAK